MGARRYDYAYEEEDEGVALETCLHDQQSYSRSESSGLYRLDRLELDQLDRLELDRLDANPPTRSGVVPISRTSAPSPLSIPRAGTVPQFIVGDRISAFALHAPPRELPIAKLIVGTVMFLAMIVCMAAAYYR
jgi:hypothetical protein